MKLDDLQQAQKLSLDVTPLLDVVFLLVLFFAVTTSFISPEKLDELKANVATLRKEKVILEDDLERNKAELAANNDRLVELDQRLLELQNALRKLASVKQAQEKTIERLRNDIIRISTEQDDFTEKMAARIAALQDANRKLEDITATQTSLIREKEGVIEDANARLRELEDRHASLTARLEALESKHRQLQMTAASLEQEKAGLVKQIEGLRASLSAAQANNEKYQAIDAQRSERQRLIDQTGRSLNAGLSTLVSEGTIAFKKHQDRLTIELSDRILFDSGSDMIKPGGLEILKRVGEVLKQHIGNIEIVVGGHTDNVPIRGKSGGLYANNWVLSAARAVSVVRYLQDEVGIPADHMTAAGYSQYRPIADNATDSGRALNRRIEIVLLPR